MLALFGVTAIWGRMILVECGSSPQHLACHGRVDHTQRAMPLDAPPPRVEIISVGPMDQDILKTVLPHFNASFVQCTAGNPLCPKRDTYSRDSQSIASYLIANYDRLPQRMAFVHGHIRAWHQPNAYEFKQRVVRALASDHQYVNVGHLPMVNTRGDNSSLDEWCTVFWPLVAQHVALVTGTTECPRTICYILGSQLVLTREAVRRLPLAFYKSLAGFLYDGIEGDLDNSIRQSARLPQPPITGVVNTRSSKSRSRRRSLSSKGIVSIDSDAYTPPPDSAARLWRHTPRYRAAFNRTLQSFFGPSAIPLTTIQTIQHRRIWMEARRAGKRPPEPPFNGWRHVRWQYAWLQTVQKRNSFMWEALAHIFFGQPACLRCSRDTSCETDDEARSRCKIRLKSSTRLVQHSSSENKTVACV